jgi:hypothetical protein
VIAHARLYLKKEKKKKSPSTPRGLLYKKIVRTKNEKKYM